jgi:hypothetical protein
MRFLLFLTTSPVRSPRTNHQTYAEGGRPMAGRRLGR